MNKVLTTIPFLSDDRKNSGAVLVTRTDYQDRTVIGVALRIGNRTMPLPRNKLRHIIEALEQGEKAASFAYQELLEEMNR